MVTVTIGLLADFTLLECPFECAVHKALAVPLFFLQPVSLLFILMKELCKLRDQPFYNLLCNTVTITQTLMIKDLELAAKYLFLCLRTQSKNNI